MTSIDDTAAGTRRPQPANDAVAPGQAPSSPAAPSNDACIIPEQRNQMVRALCDLVVLPPSRISANERSLAGDVMLHVLAGVDEKLRIEAADRMARVQDSPPAVIRAFLLDTPAVAEIILTKKESVAESLLIECIRKGGPEHRLAVTKRPDLTCNMADLLLAADERLVTLALLRRLEFALSPAAIDLCVARSMGDAEMQALLIARRELEPCHGFSMFWLVGADQRRRILARFAINRGVIQDAFHDLFAVAYKGARDPLVHDILRVLDRRHRPRARNGELIPSEVVVRTLTMARRSSGGDVIRAVSLVAGISEALAARIICDAGGEPFAVLCKGAGLSRSRFYEVLTAPEAATPFEPKQADILMAEFDGLARDYARAVLRYWDWDDNPRLAQMERAAAKVEGPRRRIGDR